MRTIIRYAASYLMCLIAINAAFWAFFGVFYLAILWPATGIWGTTTVLGKDNDWGMTLGICAYIFGVISAIFSVWGMLMIQERIA